ncbi:rplF [Wigglesworthia glossinidia endosymbiont of Glossina brevipalpis]|uniref:50S ribosomal protein L6 n=1 Tax=Wigglesworthia glossinidia brevipalpis TaxID=36870 RepID=Q8D1Z7_WIGBR|nr:rplF [Wigglesworthia glossinidia endosymbiont of Glossina brevipalpis]
MSRIARLPIFIPKSVKVKILKKNIIIIGQYGEINQLINKNINIKVNNNNIIISPFKENCNKLWAIAGTMRSIINNMIIGVTKKFTKKLIITGVGYRANISQKVLIMSLGFSHQIKIKIPEAIFAECTNSNEIILSSVDKQKIGQFAANIRNYKISDPYKGKGIRYSYEIIKIKETKKK